VTALSNKSVVATVLVAAIAALRLLLLPLPLLLPRYNTRPTVVSTARPTLKCC